MAHLHLSPDTDSLYLDVTAGDRSSVTMTSIAEGVYLHVDEAGDLVAIEVMDLASRGGLRVEDLDATEGAPRPAMFREIEARAAEGARRRHPERRDREP
ncbi:MAG: DUF2283 domain-containing protein [Candidatus Dormibacteraeota bacterium]|nr:DUF2283 domain-containing protein [Candidatus Dormibacteraeota bacterium]